MGHGSYKASDWAKLKDSRGISAHSDAGQLFRDNGLKEKYDPKFIDVRESCDSEDSPQSTPIIIGFDVTGSMGYLAAEIAKNSLNKTVTQIYEKQPVTNPHIMCAAFTSPDDAGALQVTQFEADIRIVEQLLELKVGFGGNRYSFDSLVWYFAAKHTVIDSYEKRGKKGFIFCIGDEHCGKDSGEVLYAAEIQSVFHDKVKSDLPLDKVFRLASEKYEVFHIVVGEGDYRVSTSANTWNNFIPGRVAKVEASNIQYLSEVITSIMQLANGMERSAVIKQWPDEIQPIIDDAIAGIAPKPVKNETPGPKPAQPHQADHASESVKRKSWLDRWRKK